MGEDVNIMINDKRFNFRVGVIIECNNKVLLLKNQNLDFYSIPGGRVKIGESTLDAIKREIKEEIGLEENNYELTHISENYFEWLNVDVHELLFIYKLTLDEEHPLFSKNEFTSDHPEEINYWVEKDKVKDLYCLPSILNNLITKEGKTLTHDIKHD